jgi:stage V sporulation protein SpoVS
MTDEQLIARAREYLSEKVLDLADVPKFIALLVKVWDQKPTCDPNCCKWE